MHDPAEMPARLAAFLALQEPDAGPVEVVSYEAMTGGYSRLLARAEVVWPQQDRRATYVLRGDPPADRAYIVTDRTREWEVLRAVVGRVAVSAPRYLDPTGEHLGTPALVIDHVPAASLLGYMAGRDDNRDLIGPLAEAAAAFHTLRLDQLPAALDRPASWQEYLNDRIDEWRRTARDHIESLPILRYVAAWLDAHRPPPVALGLIHGDFQSANLLRADDGRIVVLDWELAQIGDPREDLGYFRAVAQAAGPDVIGLDDEAFCARYRQLTGMTVEQLNPSVLAYFLVLGVVGTVRRMLEGGAAFARGDNHLLSSVFGQNSILFGQSMWLAFTEQLDASAAAPEV